MEERYRITLGFNDNRKINFVYVVNRLPAPPPRDTNVRAGVFLSSSEYGYIIGPSNEVLKHQQEFKHHVNIETDIIPNAYRIQAENGRWYYPERAVWVEVNKVA